MQNELNKVIEFHKVFNIPILNYPNIPDKDRCELRQNILQEEVNELKEAYLKNNIIEVADALGDILYVVLGTSCEFGLQNFIEDCFNEIHKSNMSKLDENGKPIYRKDGKITKSNLYMKPNFNKLKLFLNFE
jgi:predicted HAD superfamily Cof-like phosphohydrolase